MRLGYVIGLLLVLTTACGRLSGQPSSSDDARQVSQAVENLRSSATVRAVEASLWDADLGEPGEGLSSLGSAQDPDQAIATAPVVGDPCSEIPAMVENPQETEASWRFALGKFQACVSSYLAPAHVASGAIAYTKIFWRGLTERPLSQMTDDDLHTFLNSNFVGPMAIVGRTEAETPLRAKLRNSFSDRELDEVVRLNARRKRALMQAESSIFALVDLRRPLVEHFARTNNRYQLLLALRDTAGDVDGHKTAQAIANILLASSMYVPSHLAQFPTSYLHPVAVLAVGTAFVGHETYTLDQQQENPFKLVRAMLGELGGDLGMVTTQRKAYTQYRDSDNPPMPKHGLPAPGAVRVAVMDTGVDFLQYPDLGVFLSDGLNGTVGSGDYGDGDSNPYLVGRGLDRHGSGTTASLLTIIAKQAPEILKSRLLDLAVWKVNTNRNWLADPYQADIAWDNRQGLTDAVILRATDRDESRKPKILSVSWAFNLSGALVASGKVDAVLRAPWLWVMAAGNFGSDVSKAPAPVCLNDVPFEKRIDSRILCVGALTHGTGTGGEDRVASYSDFGERVDVYAYESYVDLCPNGTSCATPAVSGAAAVLAAKYPEITPDQIKEIIVQASDRRNLAVDGRKDSAGQTIRMNVRVFDPATMVKRMLELAAHRFGH